MSPTRETSLKPACDASCRTCVGTSTFCTSCPAGAVFNGTCVSECPPNTLLAKDSCQTCHLDCATCSAPGSASACLTCPPTRPVLSNGRCVPFCAAGSFFNMANATCISCSEGCSSCLAPDSCTACRDGFNVTAGACSPAACEGPYAAGLGTCLSSFVTKGPTTNATAVELPPVASTHSKPLFWLIGLFGALAALVLVAALYIRRERKRTRAATTEFARQMDETSVRKRLARLFGFAPADEERPRLHELILRPKASPTRRGGSDPVETAGKRAKEFDEERWIAPPPPYAPRPSSVATASQNDFTPVPLTPTLPTSLPPPPLPVALPDGRERVAEPNPTVRQRCEGAVPLSPDAVRELSERWPPLGRRYDHGVI